jgi:ppGpp synthetase/RelA/SpoT-type nucleotidyltranferase
VQTDLEGSLKLFIAQASSNEITRILGTSEFVHRVKSPESILRKCIREKVNTVQDIPVSIEDLIGLRVIALNKRDARLLFENLQGRQTEWFCDTEAPPKFVPYTIDSTNRYSMRTGYQAFHITFIHTRKFPGYEVNARWPVEIQITSRLWDFWSNYSHRYFYRGAVDESDPTGPYNLAISKILDIGEDLMVATTDAFLKPATSESSLAKEPTKQELAQPLVTDAGVKDWLARNIAELIGPRANMPNPIFISKIAYELNRHEMNLARLEIAMRDPKLRAVYQTVLSNSVLDFIPPYQQILFFILISLGFTTEDAVARVNEELQLVGMRLRAH